MKSVVVIKAGPIEYFKIARKYNNNNNNNNNNNPQEKLIISTLAKKQMQLSHSEGKHNDQPLVNTSQIFAVS